jgi:ribosomal protein S18 acetylase RimI-like enzyme
MNLHIEALTKALMHKYLPDILTEVKDFRYLNWIEENFLIDLPGKWKYSLAAVVDQTLCGFSINSNKFGVLYIHFFYVYKNYRRKGVGNNLLVACENICRRENRTALKLKCRITNASAKQFYERNGFNIIGIDEKKESYYIMQKQIS